MLKYKLFVFLGKLKCFGEFAELHAFGFAQFDFRFNAKDGFAVAVFDVDVDGVVFVTVKEETVAVFLEDDGHGVKLYVMLAVVNPLQLTPKG